MFGMRLHRRLLALLALLTLLMSSSTADAQDTATRDPGSGQPLMPECVQLLTNPDFESTTGWQRPVTPYPADYASLESEAGRRVMRLGIPDTASDRFSHSSTYQAIVIPSNATRAVLGFWVRRYSVADGGADFQEARVLDRRFNSLLTIFRTTVNQTNWERWQVDLTAMRGQRVVVYFNVFNDGDGQRTLMLVDDVSLVVCLAGEPTTVSLTGQALLQGRTNHSGVTLGLVSEGITLSEPLACAVTGPTGMFTCPMAVDEMTGVRLTADAPGYLRSELPLSASLLAQSLGTQLVAGDVNDDCRIDLVDLVSVTRALETPSPADPRLDVNGSGTVDLVDVVLVALNFDQRCPTSWSLGTPTAKREALANLTVRGLEPTVRAGDMVWVEVVASRAVYGADVRLRFDPSQLAPLADKATLGDSFRNGFVGRNEVDAKTGTVQALATRLGAASEAEGETRVLRVPFRVLAAGATVRLEKGEAIGMGVQ